MNSLLFSALISFIIYIPTSNGGYGYGGYGGNGRDVTYGRDTKGRMYDGNDRTRTRYSRGSSGSGSYSSSSSGGRRGSRSGSGNSRRSKSAPRRSTDQREATYAYGRDKRDNKQYGYDEDLMTSLIDLNVNLYKKIKDLRTEVNKIREATPPFIALNYAICKGEPADPVMNGRRRMTVPAEYTGGKEPVLCQPGGVIAYVGDAVNLQGSNYVLADGQATITDVDYPILAGILSGKFGNVVDCGTGSNEPCTVPNLSGKFILGVGINGIEIGDMGGNSDLIK